MFVAACAAVKVYDTVDQDAEFVENDYAVYPDTWY